MVKHNDVKKQDSKKIIKLFFDHEILSYWTYKKLIKLKNQNLNEIAGQNFNLVWHFKKKETLAGREGRLVHEAGHVSWMKNAAC